MKGKAESGKAETEPRPRAKGQEQAERAEGGIRMKYEGTRTATTEYTEHTEEVEKPRFGFPCGPCIPWLNPFACLALRFLGDG
jgi:hypothetical protein